MTEIWRDIGGYAGLYQVSNLGRVKSFHNGGRILKSHPDHKGYLRISLSRDDKTKTCKVHRLVATAFIPNPEDKPEVNHIDGNPRNNHVDNLEWCTASENRRHAYATGLIPQGENHARAKLTNEQARYIRENPDGLTGRELARQFGVDPVTISEIQRGKTYRNAGGQTRKPKPQAPRVPDDIRERIRAEYIPHKRGHGSHVLARKYGLGVTTVKQIINEN